MKVIVGGIIEKNGKICPIKIYRTKESKFSSYGKLYYEKT